MTTVPLKVFDKAKYHYERDDFPEWLTPDQAYVHTGFFWGWIIDRNLVSDEMRADFAHVIERFRNREITGPRAYALVGGCFASDMLNDEGFGFADVYFDLSRGKYIADYLGLLGSALASNYDVQDTWANYETLKIRIDQRFVEYQNGGLT